MVSEKSKDARGKKNGGFCLPESSCCGCDLKSSTTTRLYYTVFLLVATIMCFIVLAPETKKKLYSTPHLCSELLDSHICANLVGYSAVYRICFAVASFFFTLSVLFVQVKFVDELRARIHNGFWYFKFVAFVGKYTVLYMSSFDQRLTWKITVNTDGKEPETNVQIRSLLISTKSVPCHQPNNWILLVVKKRNIRNSVTYIADANCKSNYIFLEPYRSS